ncbi:TBC1 domain family member 22A-like [Zophobas morio]|uniref:TBC1 domain family member 22A-like n=1 Tax=Zophobas morio TaxID=2755281 RepID=UPI003082B893
MCNNSDEKDYAYRNKGEFLDLLNPEGFLAVDQLRKLSLTGIPDDLRSSVWKYLLGVSISDIAEEEFNRKERAQQYASLFREYSEDLKFIKVEIYRYRSDIPLFSDPNVQKTFINVITSYLTQNPQLRYTASLVHLCGPLIYVYLHSPDTELPIPKQICSFCEPFVYYSFQSLLSRLKFDEDFEDYFREMLGNLINLMRELIPELQSHFDDEELELKDWAHSWIRSLLAYELPMCCLLRLWDTYFSHEDGLGLHPYVCLAILVNLKEDLEELDHSDLLRSLRKLPDMDMDKVVIAQAFNFKFEITGKNIL